MKDPIATPIRKCLTCNTWQALDSFHHKQHGKYGRDSRCKQCSVIEGKARNLKCKVHIKEYNRRHNLAVKQSIVDHYGGRCACCGEDDIRFLTVDHIKNDGKTHRKELGGKVGTAFYYWIKRNNYPQDLQLLCWNCNLGKYYYGECPHKEKQNVVAC